ncbi:hypothetical protein HMPREF9554_01651 [Treponema phagedenis F0421]|nr:hypothetical protein HMPREF9554_01651 [Treponema phagedenis F0421]
MDVKTQNRHGRRWFNADGLVLPRTAKSEQIQTMFKNYHTDINRSF